MSVVLEGPLADDKTTLYIPYLYLKANKVYTSLYVRCRSTVSIFHDSLKALSHKNHRRIMKTEKALLQMSLTALQELL